MAQVEGAGNPVARTYWRWRLTWHPFAIYQPASSAVGMYQMTDAAFAEARRYCIRHHTVIDDGVWDDWRSCWFNGLYTRVVPSHAIELTAVFWIATSRQFSHAAPTRQRVRSRSRISPPSSISAAQVQLKPSRAAASN